MEHNPTAVSGIQPVSHINSYLNRVYFWMAAGLAITAIVAWFCVSTPHLLMTIYKNRVLWYGLLFGELGLVFVISGAINRLSGATATLLFALYSGLNGVTISYVCALYTGESVATAFFSAAFTFMVAALYGYFTKRDLSSFGSFMFMGLVGIVIASLVNLFFRSPGVYWVTTYIGVVVFIGLTVYDMNKIKGMAYAIPDDVDSNTIQKGAILGALTLYLDFINLFLLLLRIFGRRR